MPRTRQRSPVRPSPLNSEIEVWYQKLEDSGFEDIEQSPDSESPLKDWHSFSFTSIESQARKRKREVYQAKIDAFANSPEFPEITQLMVRHRNNLYNALQVEKIWDMHRDGVPERDIALEMGCSQSCIHFMLKRMREWMSLIA